MAGLTLGELSGIISLDEKPAMSALGRVRQGMRDTANEGQKATDKLDAQQQRHAAAVEAASERVGKARQRESNAARALGVAEAGLAEVRRKGADGSAQIVTAEARVATAHQRVRASQDATAKSTRDLEVAQERMASTSESTSKRASSSFDQMGNSGNRAGRTAAKGFAALTLGLTGIVPAAGAGGSALLAMAGSALTLGGSIKSLLGVTALAPAALFAVGSGAGVLLSAFSGMGEALTAASEQTSESAGSAALDAMTLADAARAVAIAERTTAEQQVDAGRRVQEAKRALTRVVEDNAEQQAAALRRVAYAERDVESANERVTASQRDLNDARREAVDRLEDLEDSLKGAGLSEREAAIRLEEAQAAFEEGATRGGTPSLEYRKLKLDLDQAGFGLEEAKERTADLAAEQAQASKEGVNGNRRVLDAQEAVTDAEVASRDAVTALGEARAEVDKTALEGAERLTDARLALEDAEADVARAQRDGLESVADATRNLERVQIQQADAAAEAGKKSVDAMDKLTPSAKLAAVALLDVYERLGDVRDIAQENFFDGFADPLLDLADTVLPQLERGVGGLATAYGIGAQTIIRALDRELGNGVLESMFEDSTDAAYILNDAIDPIVAALITLTDVGMEYMPELAGYIRDAATEFDGFIQNAAEEGSLRRWIDDGIQGFKDVFSIVGSVVGIFDKLEDAARTAGFDTTLGSIADGLDRIEATAGGEVFQSTLSTIFAGAKGGADGLLAALGPIGAAFETGGPALAEFLRLGGEIAGTFVGSMFTALSDPEFGSGLTSFLEDVQDGVEKMGPKLPDLFDALGGILESAGPIVEAFGPTAVDVLIAFADGFAAILDFAEPLMTEMADSPALIGTLVGVLGAAATLNALSGFATGIGGVATAFRLMWAAASGPVGWIIAGITLVAAATLWWATETETGQKVMQDGAWALYNAWQDTSWLYDNIIKPRMVNAVLEVSTAFSDFTTDTAINAVTVMTNTERLAIWWAQRFLDMKTATTTEMVEIAGSVAGMKTDLDTRMVEVAGILAKVPGYSETAKTGASTHLVGLAADALTMKSDVDGRMVDLAAVMAKVPGYFDEAQNGAKGYLGDLASDALGMKNDIDTYMSALNAVLEKVPGYFDAMKTGAMDALDLIREESKVPIRFVVNTVFGGLVETLWKYIPGVDEKNLPKPKLPDGFATGGRIPGYSPSATADNIPIMATANEFMVRQASAMQLEQKHPGFLDYINQYGTVPGIDGYATGGFIWPVGGQYPITQRPSGGHQAYDIGTPVGTPVKAAADGRVSLAGPGYRAPGVWGGTEAHIDHGGGVGSLYAHLSSLLVRVGDMVKQNQTIAMSGNTGISSGPHLHFGGLNGYTMVSPDQYLNGGIPGGAFGGMSGGEAGPPANPLDGVLDTLMDKFAKAFPDGGMFVDAAAGIAKSGLGSAVKVVDDIKDGVSDVVGDVFDNIRSFFGVGGMTLPDSVTSMTPTLMDGGGWLHDTDGPTVVHRTKKPDAFTPNDEWQAMKKDYLSRPPVVVNSTVEYVGEDPEQFADRERRRMLDAFNAYA